MALNPKYLPSRGSYRFLRRGDCSVWMSDAVPNAKINNQSKSVTSKRDQLLAKYKPIVGKLVANAALSKVGVVKEVGVSWLQYGTNPSGYLVGYVKISVLDKKGKPGLAKVNISTLIDYERYLTDMKAHVAYLESIKDPLKAYYESP